MKIAERFQTRVNDAREMIADFAQKVLDTPAYALEWSNSAFTAAAQREVFGQVLAGLENEMPVEELRGIAQREINRRARNPSHSTSQPSNLLDEQRLQAWAEALELLEEPS